MHRRAFTQAVAGFVSAGSAGLPALAAPPARRPVVLELFTSQGCSSCPPADALLLELARDRAAELLPLAFHVTYWDRLGWRDPFSLQGATDRQRRYASVLGRDGVYTPQLVVDGSRDVVGSERRSVLDAIAKAAARATADVPLAIRRHGADAVIEIGAGAVPVSATVLLVGYDRQHETPVGRGENGGRTLLEANIVRSIDPLGPWDGSSLTLRRPAPPGERLAVLIQADDGRMLGASQENTPLN